MAEYLQANQSGTIPLKDGRTRFVRAGDVFRKSELSDFLVEQLDGDDPHYAGLFSNASQADHEEANKTTYADPAMETMLKSEEISRARAEVPVEDRLGGKSPVLVPARLDPGRTLPESGGDAVAAEKFAAGEEGKDRTTQLEELGIEPGKSAQDTGNLQPEMPSETTDLKKPVARRAEKKAEKESSGAPKADPKS